MGNTIAIMRRELHSMFVSPIAYIVIMLFLIITGLFNFSHISRFTEIYAQYQAYAQAMRNPQILQQLNINQWIFQPLLSTMSVVLIFMIPLITMRTFSEEKRSGVDELLLTSPLTTLQIVLGKFFASFLFYLVLIGCTLIYPGILIKFGNPDVWSMLAGYIGLLFLGTSYLVFGLFASSLTKNQVVAAAISFVVLLMFWLIGYLGEKAPDTLKNVLTYLTLIEHFSEFTKGVINTKDITFFASFIFVFLFLTKMSLDSLRWR